MTDWSLVCSFFAARRKMLEAQCHYADSDFYTAAFDTVSDIWATLMVNDERMPLKQRLYLFEQTTTLMEAVQTGILSSHCSTSTRHDHGKCVALLSPLYKHSIDKPCVRRAILDIVHRSSMPLVDVWSLPQFSSCRSASEFLYVSILTLVAFL